MTRKCVLLYYFSLQYKGIQFLVHPHWLYAANKMKHRMRKGRRIVLSMTYSTRSGAPAVNQGITWPTNKKLDYAGRFVELVKALPTFDNKNYRKIMILCTIFISMYTCDVTFEPSLSNQVLAVIIGNKLKVLIKFIHKALPLFILINHQIIIYYCYPFRDFWWICL